MHASDRDLGMARSISRRDFLNGVGVALTGRDGAAVARRVRLAAGSQAPQQAPDYYPPRAPACVAATPGPSR